MSASRLLTTLVLLGSLTLSVPAEAGWRKRTCRVRSCCPATVPAACVETTKTVEYTVCCPQTVTRTVTVTAGSPSLETRVSDLEAVTQQQGAQIEALIDAVGEPDAE